jgi:hypothetical protein
MIHEMHDRDVSSHLILQFEPPEFVVSTRHVTSIARNAFARNVSHTTRQAKMEHARADRLAECDRRCCLQEFPNV